MNVDGSFIDFNNKHISFSHLVKIHENNYFEEIRHRINSNYFISFVFSLNFDSKESNPSEIS